MSGMSFKQMREMQRAVSSGAVKLIRPDVDALNREMAYINEVRSLWEARKDFALKLVESRKGLTAAKLPTAEEARQLLDSADMLAREQLSRTVSESMEVLVYLERPIPEQLAFLARVLDLPVPEVKPGEAAKETGPRSVLVTDVGNA